MLTVSTKVAQEHELHFWISALQTWTRFFRTERELRDLVQLFSIYKWKRATLICLLSAMRLRLKTYPLMTQKKVTRPQELFLRQNSGLKVCSWWIPTMSWPVSRWLWKKSVPQVLLLSRIRWWQPQQALWTSQVSQTFSVLLVIFALPLERSCKHLTCCSKHESREQKKKKTKIKL